jgi:hypothetical protein
VEGKARGVEWSARPHLPSLQKGFNSGPYGGCMDGVSTRFLGTVTGVTMSHCSTYSLFTRVVLPG